MDKQDIKLSDWMRILFGNASLEFLIEVFIRTLIMYVLLLICIRFLGKRMSGQLSVTELSVMLLLGAVVSAPMQMPDRGLLQGLWLLIIILVLQRTIAWWGTKSAKVEKITQGEATILVRDGLIDVKELLNTRISREELLKQVRSKGYYQLGEIKRVYMEASGNFSIYKADEVKPGLSTFPLADHDIENVHKEAGKDLKACGCCGNTQTITNPNTPCNICHSIQWLSAVL